MGCRARTVRACDTGRLDALAVRSVAGLGGTFGGFHMGCVVHFQHGHLDEIGHERKVVFPGKPKCVRQATAQDRNIGFAMAAICAARSRIWIAFLSCMSR